MHCSLQNPAVLQVLWISETSFSLWTTPSLAPPSPEVFPSPGACSIYLLRWKGPTLYFLDAAFLVFLKIRAEGDYFKNAIFLSLLGVRNDFSLMNSFFACHPFW